MLIVNHLAVICAGELDPSLLEGHLWKRYARVYVLTHGWKSSRRPARLVAPVSEVSINRQ